MRLEVHPRLHHQVHALAATLDTTTEAIVALALLRGLALLEVERSAVTGRVESFKGIAHALGQRLGWEPTEMQVRAWAVKGRDPLPLDYFAGRPAARLVELDAWIGRMKGARQVRRRSERGR